MERMLQHQRFQLAIVFAALEGPLQKGKTNLDLAFRRIEIVISRASNGPSRLSLDHRKGALRLYGSIEVALKNFSFVSVSLGVLLPDKRIVGSREQRVEILP